MFFQKNWIKNLGSISYIGASYTPENTVYKLALMDPGRSLLLLHKPAIGPNFEQGSFSS